MAPDSPDDMNDDGKSQKPPLQQYVDLTYRNLYPLFHERDQAAIAAQTAHREGTWRTATFGALALLLGSFELAFHQTARAWTVLEFGFAILTLVLVLTAIFQFRRDEWLLKRWKAEQLRLLKYRFLLQPNLWGRNDVDLGGQEERLSRARDDIDTLDHEDLGELSHHEQVPALPTVEECASVDRDRLRDFVAYYRNQRLGCQLAYFHGKTEARRPWYDHSAALPFFFFGGVAFVLFHMIVEIVECATASHGFREFLILFFLGASPATSHAQSADIELLKRLLAFVSVSLPIIWAGIRTHRTAQEFSRNLLRSHARYRALSRVHSALGGHLEKTDMWLDSAPPGDTKTRVTIYQEIKEIPDPPTTFAYLNLAEFILASDQREWLRLMLEAEWYG